MAPPLPASRYLIKQVLLSALNSQVKREKVLMKRPMNSAADSRESDPLDFN